MTVTQQDTQCLNCGADLLNSRHALCQECFDELPYRNVIRSSQNYGEYTMEGLDVVLSQGGKVQHFPDDGVIVDFPKGSFFEGARGGHWIRLPNGEILYHYDGDARNLSCLSHIDIDPFHKDEEEPQSPKDKDEEEEEAPRMDRLLSILVLDDRNVEATNLTINRHNNGMTITFHLWGEKFNCSDWGFSNALNKALEIANNKLRNRELGK